MVNNSNILIEDKSILDGFGDVGFGFGYGILHGVSKCEVGGDGCGHGATGSVGEGGLDDRGFQE